MANGSYLEKFMLVSNELLIKKNVKYSVALNRAGFLGQCLGYHLGKCCCFMDFESVTSKLKITWLELETQGKA